MIFYPSVLNVKFAIHHLGQPFWPISQYLDYAYYKINVLFDSAAYMYHKSDSEWLHCTIGKVVINRLDELQRVEHQNLMHHLSMPPH